LANTLKRTLCLTVVATMLAACNPNIDLASIQKLGKTADEQAPAFAAIAGDFYASCQRGLAWRLTGHTPVVPGMIGLTPQQQHAIGEAIRQATEAQAAVDRLVKSHAAPPAIAAAKRRARGASGAVTAAMSPLVAAQHAADDANEKLDPANPPPAPAKTQPTTPAPVATAKPASTPSPLLTVNNTGDPCQIGADAAQQWQTVNLIVLNYVRALANLAGAREKSDNTFGLDTLAGTLSDQGLFKKGQGTAIQGAVSSVIRDVFAQKRRDAIAKSAPLAEKSLNAVIGALEDVANVDYRQVLTQERRDVNHFFRDNFHAAPNGIPALKTLAYRQQWKDELAAIDKRVAAINDYVGTLEAFRKAHKALLSKVGQGDFSDFYSIVSAYVAEYQPRIDDITKAYAGSPKAAKS